MPAAVQRSARRTCIAAGHAQPVGVRKGLRVCDRPTIPPRAPPPMKPRSPIANHSRRDPYLVGNPGTRAQ
jgi:hypothetical protein